MVTGIQLYANFMQDGALAYIASAVCSFSDGYKWLKRGVPLSHHWNLQI